MSGTVLVKMPSVVRLLTRDDSKLDDRWVICNFTVNIRRVRLLKLPPDDPPTSIKMAERDMDFRVSSNGRWLVSGYSDD